LAAKGKERSVHSEYVLQFAELDKRFQHIDLADDFTVLNFALPEHQLARYVSTAYAYHHILKKTLISAEVLQTLMNVIETSSHLELLDQVRVALHALPRQTYAELKFSVGHLLRISRLTVLDCVPGMTALFTSPMIVPMKPTDVIIEDKAQFLKAIFLPEMQEDLIRPEHTILQLMLRYFNELFSNQSANQDTAKWRERVTTLQEAGGEMLGLSSGAEGWKEALTGERKLTKNVGGSMYL